MSTRQELKDRIITLKARMAKGLKALEEFPAFPEDEIRAIRDEAGGVVDDIEDELCSALSNLEYATGHIADATSEVGDAINDLESAVATINLAIEDEAQGGNGDSSEPDQPADEAHKPRTVW